MLECGLEVTLLVAVPYRVKAAALRISQFQSNQDSLDERHNRQHKRSRNEHTKQDGQPLFPPTEKISPAVERQVELKDGETTEKDPDR